MLVIEWITSPIESLALILARSQPWHIASYSTMPMAFIKVGDHVMQSSEKQMGWKARLLAGLVALWVVEQQARSPVVSYVALPVWLPIGLMACLMA